MNSLLFLKCFGLHPYYNLWGTASLLFCTVFLGPYSNAQDPPPKWDDPFSHWPEEVKEISIPGSGEAPQKAMFYSPPIKEVRPLIVSLHTWSGDYRQKDTLSWMAMARKYYYIHPDFQGPNTHSEACGSALVINDIDDAIAYAIDHGNVDTDNIHVIGTSGGGHATLLTYMRSKHAIKSFTAFVPISNLVDWYYESLGRSTKYAKNIAMVTSGRPDSLNTVEAKKRSPFFMEIPKNREQSRLSIFCGIHDGYTGSVPITQSLHFYNKIVRALDSQCPDSIIEQDDIETLLRQRNFGPKDSKETLMERRVIYSRSCGDKVKVAVFEGGHEMPKGDVLGLLNIGCGP
ncbi:MAG: prolyl oligopeptidase family serine peptidase [Bacteroidota bacterium]